MQVPLEIINRFFGIITESSNRGNERLQSQWSYLYKLLSSQPVAFDRIDAYLNILQQQDKSQKKNISKIRKSQTEHPEYKKFLGAVQELADFMEENQRHIVGIKKKISY